jgi:hypothetical protein
MTTSILLLCAVRDVLEQKFKINADYIRIISEFENPGGREISNTALQDLINKQHLFLKSPPYKNDNYYVNYKIFFEYL